ncbi:MAG TPA: TlpA disulfide reductase family protein [Terriglobales bacterium]|nr:TlpA disulfide reductase family protein [Terriglobales bacterium]
MRRLSARSLWRRLPAAALVLAAASAFAGSPAREPAPRFTAKTMGGETFTNASVKGKVVLLEFWATWCEYCTSEEALVDSIDKEFSPKGLIVLAVDVGESKKKVKKYLAQNPRAVRIVLTDDTNLAAMYAATSYPIYVVIDRDGNIAGIQRGAAGEGALRRLLRRAGLESDE